MELLIAPPQTEKMSEIIIDFAQPLMDAATSDSAQKMAITTAIIGWNLSFNFKRASFPKLKPSLKSISIRLPEDMLAELKIIANKKDVPYQSLAKIYLARQIALERGSASISPKNNASH